MNTLADRSLRRLSVVTAAAVAVLIVMGGIVRTTGSGLGCPDWPLCYGRAVPPADVTAWIEFAHRFLAAVTGGLMIATLLAAWRHHRADRALFAPISLAVGLLVIQVPLGAVVVLTELQPLIVAFHLGMAMVILACVLLTAVAANRALPRREQGNQPGPALIIAAAGATFLLMLTGAWVAGSGAQLACPDWPLCYARVLPPQGSSAAILIQLVHRFSVAAVSLLVIAVIVQTFRRRALTRGVLNWTVLLGAFFAMQVMVGAFQVLMLLATVWRVLHLAFATATWAALVALAAHTFLVARLERVPARDAARSGSPVPAGD